MSIPFRYTKNYQYWTIQTPSELLYTEFFITRKLAIAEATKTTNISWEYMRRNGYKCVKVKITEVGK